MSAIWSEKYVAKMLWDPNVVVAVRSLEVTGCRFSEVTDILQVWDLQSVTSALSALQSVSASRTVSSGRFYCNISCQVSNHVKISNTRNAISSLDKKIP